MPQVALKPESSPSDGSKSIDRYLADGYTPMMAQYHALKEAHPGALLFYRMGDFYELFFEDAEIAAKILDITLTKRGKTGGTDIPMCGVPFHSYEPYLERLIRAGHKVAICEQTETPAEAKTRAKREGRPASKTLVNREVVRIVTQGTLTEDTLLQPRENNYLACIAETAGDIGVSWLELSTGSFHVQSSNHQSLIAALERISAKEILISEKMNLNIENPKILTRQSHSLFDSQNAQKRLETTFGVNTLKSFGDFSRAEIAAAGSLLDYVNRTQKGRMPYLEPPKQMAHDETMQIDAATRRNLELTRTLDGQRKGSLLDTIDRTLTAAGARMLQSRIATPLTDLKTINARLTYVQHFHDNTEIRETIREYLQHIPDLERALSRLNIGRGGPRDLLMIRDGLKQIQIIRSLLQNDPASCQTLKPVLETLSENPVLAELQDTLEQSITNHPPALTRDGCFIAEGYNKKLDQLKALKDDSKHLIAGLQQQYKKRSKIDTLKIKFNNVLGYFIEVPARRADEMMIASNDNPFIHRQTLANAVRFTTTELSELERDIMSAAEKSLALELEIFEKLVQQTTTCSQEIYTKTCAIAALDIAASHAHLAIDQNYCIPALSDSLQFEIENGRHPVVETALKDQNENFIPNNCDLNEGNNLWLLTGPNMAGKSTYLRQNALIAILAQIGSFVPADAAKIGIVDRVFSRVGASDDLAKGRSTFMVEMIETAAILNQATERSLVILDEIGRGTATFDGLSIAWACIEYLHDINKCRTLFATHYHELTSLTSRLNNLSCHAMQVKEWKGDIIFLHTVGEGAANQSYGIHVGKLAGLPASVITRAKDVLNHLQSGKQSGRLTALAEDLPLFAMSDNAQTAIESSELEQHLKTLNPDDLSPKEALETIYKLKELLHKS